MGNKIRKRDDSLFYYYEGAVNTDENDLARKARVSASSYKGEERPEKVIDGISRHYEGVGHSWVSDGISKDGEKLTLKWEKLQHICQLRITFDSNFNYPIRCTMAPKRQAQQRVGVPPELVKDYTLSFYKGEVLVFEKSVNDNIQRFNVIDFKTVCCDKLL